MSGSKQITAIKGMNDILPPESARWEWLEDVVRRVMAQHAYRNVRTPIMELTQLYTRGLGEVTDIVEKEMYAFEDRADQHGRADHLALRPEGTAGLVRAVAEHNLLYDGGKRLFYLGPMFRRERPQRGRYRQFHQIGAEALGFGGPEVDAELILLAVALWRELGITRWRLELNSLGQPDERREHRAALVAYFEAHHEQLDEDARRRLHSNPLRILDTKNPAMQALVEGAPKMLDYLGEASRRHFAAVQAILAAAGVEWRLNPRLVRGLDYYNLTVFEWKSPHLGAQSTVCGGGRYDQLIETLGGKPAPGIGFGLGMERLMLLLEATGKLAPAAAPDAYAVLPDAAALPRVLPLLAALRARGLAIVMHAAGKDGQGSMKSQFKRADASGARWALVFGADELAQGMVALKPLRDATAAQALASLADVGALAARLRAAGA